jgi:hypothetical protein
MSPGHSEFRSTSLVMAGVSSTVGWVCRPRMAPPALGPSRTWRTASPTDPARRSGECSAGTDGRINAAPRTRTRGRSRVRAEPAVAAGFLMAFGLGLGSGSRNWGAGPDRLGFDCTRTATHRSGWTWSWTSVARVRRWAARVARIGQNATATRRVVQAWSRRQRPARSSASSRWAFDATPRTSGSSGASAWRRSA